MPTITFLGGSTESGTPTDVVIEVDAGTSLLTAAKKGGAEVGYACGGVCACSTCHVYVKEGRDSLSDQEEAEEDILDKAFDVRATSRLGCQTKCGTENLVIELSRESRRAWMDEHPEERAKRVTKS